VLVRYNLNLNSTHVSIRVTSDSGLNAGEIATSLVDGRGSRSMGGGSVNGIVTPDKLFSM
jgi:hypothetical protein